MKVCDSILIYVSVHNGLDCVLQISGLGTELKNCSSITLEALPYRQDGLCGRLVKVRHRLHDSGRP